MGYILARNAYPAHVVVRMLVRPLVGAVVSFALLDTHRGRFHAATLAGRVRGLKAGARLGHERREERRMALEPVAEREALHGARTRRGGVAVAVGQHGGDGRGELLGGGRLVALVAVGVWHADAPSSPTSSTVPPLAA